MVALIKSETGIETIGLRLREGDDYPYYTFDGFSEDFIRTENFLVVRDSKIWSAEHVSLFRIVPSIISAAIDRARHEERVAHLTYRDQLTDMNNRLFFREELRRLDVEREFTSFASNNPGNGANALRQE